MLNILVQIANIDIQPLETKLFQILHSKIVFNADVAVIVELIVFIHIVDKGFKDMLHAGLLGGLPQSFSKFCTADRSDTKIMFTPISFRILSTTSCVKYTKMTVKGF